MTHNSPHTFRKPASPKAKKPAASRNVKMPAPPRAKKNTAAIGKRPLSPNVEKSPQPKRRSQKFNSSSQPTSSRDPKGWRGPGRSSTQFQVDRIIKQEKKNNAEFERLKIDAAELWEILERLEIQLNEISRPMDEEGRWEGFEDDTDSEMDGEWEPDTGLYFEVVILKKEESELRRYKGLEADKETGERFRGPVGSPSSVFSVVIYTSPLVRRSLRSHHGLQPMFKSMIDYSIVMQQSWKGKRKVQ